MPLSAQITMLLVLMVSSKGLRACRALRSSWWRRCCPCSTCQRPVVLLILGIDHFLDMGRTLTNVMGNAIATAVVAKWEGHRPRARCLGRA